MATIRERKIKGGKSYTVIVRLRGGKHRTRTFRRKTDAKQWASKTESAIRDGQAISDVEARKHTVGETIDAYLEHHKDSTSTHARNVARHLEWWRSQVGHVRLSDINAATLTECKDKLVTGSYRGRKRKNTTINRFLVSMSSLFRYAIKQKHWLMDNPMRGVEKFPEPKGRVRFLSDDELDRLLDACRRSDEPYLYPVVLLALSTGARKGEIMNLLWSNVDLQKGTALVPTSKNEDPRVLPLVGEALEQIKGLRQAKVQRIDTDLLFPRPDGQAAKIIDKWWRQARADAQIENFRFHDLRHCCASYLAMNGASLLEIADVLGHRTLEMTKRYAHLNTQHKADLIQSMVDKKFGV